MFTSLFFSCLPDMPVSHTSLFDSDNCWSNFSVYWHFVYLYSHSQNLVACEGDWSRIRQDWQLIKAVWIMNSKNINQDEGSYQLSHVWDKLLTDVRNGKPVRMKISDRRSKRRWTSGGGVCLLLQAGVQPTLDPSAETFISVQCTSPGRGGELVGVCDVCAFCRVEEGTVGVSSLLGYF